MDGVCRPTQCATLGRAPAPRPAASLLAGVFGLRGWVAVSRRSAKATYITLLVAKRYATGLEDRRGLGGTRLARPGGSDRSEERGLGQPRRRFEG